MNWIPSIIGAFVGAGIGIICAAPARARLRYAIRAFVFYFIFFTGGLGLAFMNELVAHMMKRERLKMYRR